MGKRGPLYNRSDPFFVAIVQVKVKEGKNVSKKNNILFFRYTFIYIFRNQFLPEQTFAGTGGSQ